MLKFINRMEKAQAAGQFKRWILDNGVKQPGLVTRRKKERDLFLS